MSEKKELTTLEVQDLIYERRKKLFEMRKGKTLEQLIDEANRPKRVLSHE